MKVSHSWLYVCIPFQRIDGVELWRPAAIEEREVGDGVMEVVRGTRPLEWWGDGSGRGMGDLMMAAASTKTRMTATDEDDDCCCRG